MATLLQIDSSPMGDYSVSRQLTKDFAEAWTAAHPEGTVTYRDLHNTSGLGIDHLTPVTGAWIGAAHTPKDAATEEQKAILAVSDTLLAELFAADEIVIGVPMHNFAPPSVLKLWIDLIVRAGITFRYGANGPEGLVKGKKLTLLIATGGEYGPGSPAAGYNFVEPYLRAVFGFLGITDVTVVTAGGTAALMQGADRATFLAPFEAQVKALVA
jgi:FMN-dependent NADH-azoreductase